MARFRIVLVFLAAMILFAAVVTTAAQKRVLRPQDKIDADYVEALGTANEFLSAWQLRDQTKFTMFSQNIRKHHSEEELREYLSGVSNPHHAAYEICDGKRMGAKSYGFRVRLYTHYTGENVKNPKPAQVILRLVKEGQDWKVDNMPKVLQML